ncbi:uncharacterized protein LOC118183037 [Stegodyphus dumicola]|uniref:uncharacterized protein LOC118183037 n=1 Tax=Stegodyphus dumicola TaxID=202533 RepID=UPI0015A889A1|nr:uncharacterized protein LOC118183037 [Stegodyphus dumicola]
MTHSLELNQRTLVQYPSASHLLAGDFNAHSKVWYYPSTDARGRTIEDFMASNDLTLHNTEDSPPTYETVHGRGWPDLTLTSASLAPFIQQWTVQDLPSNSDHLYITYNICHPHTRMTLKRYKLTKRKTAQFINKVRFSLRSAEEDLTACTTSQDLESFTSSLISTIQDICNSTFSLKTRKTLHMPNWWTKDLRAQRSKTRAMRRRMKAEYDQEARLALSISYRKAQAEYKRAILNAKLACWRNFCTNNTDIYGALFKIARGSVFKPPQLRLFDSSPPEQETTKEAVLSKILDAVFPNDSQEEFTENSHLAYQLFTTATDDPPFQDPEVNAIMRILPKRKAPGPD